MRPRKDLISLSPLTISLIYLVVASLWILLTDRLVEFLLKDPDKITLIQTYKGWFYVIMTSMGLFYLISKYDEIKNGLIRKQEKDLELRTKLLEKIPVMITIYDPQLEKIQVNLEFTKVTGYSNEDVNTLDLMKACYPDEKYRKEVLEFMSQPEKGWKEILLTTKSGDQIYNSWTNLLLADDTKVGIGIDLSEIRESEKELKERNSFIESIIENIPIGISVHEINTGDAILINDQFSDIYGWPKDVINDVEDFFNHVYQDPAFRDKMEKRITEDLMSGDPEKMVWDKIPIDTKNEGKKYVSAKNIPLPDQNIMISTVLDLTTGVLAEKELIDSEERYRHIFQNNPQPMWIFDLKTLQFLEVNEVAITEYGYSRKEFLSMKISDIRSDSENERLSKGLDTSFKKSDVEEEWIHLKKNGQEKIVNIYGTGIDFENRPARLILVNDITEKKKNKELLISSAIEGEDKERKRIAQELHDGIGQYLSAVNLNMESIKNEISHLTDKKQDRFLSTLSIVKKAMKETRSMAYMLMPLELEEYGLLVAVKSLAREIEGSSEVKIKMSISGVEDILDKHMKSNFYRIIQEAFNNAVKHGNADLIELTLKHEKKFFYCIIKDNGEGIDISELKKSTGLGMKSIKARTETMSGLLNIKSKPGEGLEIAVRAPVKQTSTT